MSALPAPRSFALPNRRQFAQKHGMEKQQETSGGFGGFVRWAMTPPQSIAVYLACLFLVAGLSFYVGTLKPKKAVGIGPPPVTAPRN